MAETFKLTYATMFNPPEELHQNFDRALEKVKAKLGSEYGLIINNQDVFAEDKFEDRNPANTDQILAVMQKGNETNARVALQAAAQGLPRLEHDTLA